MILKDGIYEAEGLFSTDGGFTIKVEGGEMKFFESVGPANRLKLAVMDPFSRLLQSDKVVSAPFGFTPERCEFDKSLVKTILSAGTDDELAGRVSGMIKTLTGCSLFESAFIMWHLSECGLAFFTAQDVRQPVRKGLDRVKPDQAISTMCRMIMNDPCLPGFRMSMSAKAKYGDPEDIRLHRQLTEEAVWRWTEADSEECLAILVSSPFFRERPCIRPEITEPQEEIL